MGAGARCRRDGRGSRVVVLECRCRSVGGSGGGCINCGRGWAAQPLMMSEAEQQTLEAIFWERTSTTGGNCCWNASVERAQRAHGERS